MSIQYFDPSNLIQQYMNPDGTGQTDFNLTGNYSDAGLGATTFKYTPPAGMVAHLDGITLFMSAATAFTFDNYVPGSALTNGYQFTHSGKNIDFPTLLPIVAIGSYLLLGGQGGTTALQGGTTTQYASAHISFAGLFFKALDVNSEAGEELTVILNDDMSGLGEHLFLLHGNLTPIGT